MGSQNPLRDLPSVTELLAADPLTAWHDQLPRKLIVAAARDVLADRRRQLSLLAPSLEYVSVDELAAQVAERLKTAEHARLPAIINATGIILHTNVGRAPLGASAVDALLEVARNYVPLEIDLTSGQRGRRTRVVADLICQATGAEAATVVNNNAAALLVTLAALARQREVVVSRGELIEIGGGFRLPEIIETGGAHLAEVGTTNRTRRQDYAAAISDRTGAILKVHPSNYRLSGFVEETPLEDLAELAEHHGVPLVYDVGSGALTEMAMSGVAEEPLVPAALAAGAEVVLFSGDKLLGGPQAGLIAGRREYVEMVNRHPLMRAMRVDKLTLAALAATLKEHLDPARARQRLPVLAMLSTPVEELEARARRLAEKLRTRGLAGTVEIAADAAYLGGGSLPQQELPSVTLRWHPVSSASETEIAARLRLGQPPVLPRVRDGAVIFDLRTVFAAQDEALVDAMLAAS